MNKFTENDYIDLCSKVAGNRANEFEKSVIEVSGSISSKVQMDTFLNPGLIAAGAIIEWWNKFTKSKMELIIKEREELRSKVNELESKLNKAETIESGCIELTEDDYEIV